MFKKIAITALTLFVFVSCKDGNNANRSSGANYKNPLMQESTLPFEVPPFDKIQTSDFLPAFEAGMEQQLEEINIIATNEATPTFENTLVALEKSGQLLTRVQHVFGILTSANTNPDLQEIQQEIAPQLAAHYDAIYLNDSLFERVKTIYNNREELELDPESQRLVEYYYQQFLRAGANLSAEDKTKLKELNKKAASLSTSFNNKLLAATK
ncbi:MAG TPA: hypothetical protein VK106_05890, partial [Balneolaceae bacterium]|nr:hypothetical protein [Balneolaceae bacterium]